MPMGTNDKEKPDTIPVAQQKAEGVPDDQTVTVAEQRSDAFTDEDRAELDALRKDRKDRETKEEADRRKEEEARPPVSHYLHLANGEIVESAGTMTDHHGVAVIGAYPIEEREDDR